ncbi:MAG: pentapeptide repeat-containing protein [Gammaproteobacteria bacterium]|nr:pentapeptide repeat-containing protein [Gammaproteobacteria bacterium]
MIKITTAGLFLILQFSFSSVFSACEDPPAAGVDWNNCIKRSVILIGMDLRNANLSSTDFMFADLENTDLSGANLSGSIMLGANLEGVNFENSNMTSAYLTKAKIAGAIFNGAILDSTYWVNGQQCSSKSIGLCK